MTKPYDTSGAPKPGKSAAPGCGGNNGPAQPASKLECIEWWNSKVQLVALALESVSH